MFSGLFTKLMIAFMSLLISLFPSRFSPELSIEVIVDGSELRVAVTEDVFYGCKWFCENSNDGVLELSDTDYEQYGLFSGNFGTADKDFHFKAVSKGTTTLTFKYYREKTDEVYATAIFKVKVNSKLEITSVEEIPVVTIPERTVA